MLKKARLLAQVQAHMSIVTHADKSVLGLEYLDMLVEKLSDPLLKKEKEGGN